MDKTLNKKIKIKEGEKNLFNLYLRRERKRCKKTLKEDYIQPQALESSKHRWKTQNQNHQIHQNYKFLEKTKRKKKKKPILKTPTLEEEPNQRDLQREYLLGEASWNPQEEGCAEGVIILIFTIAFFPLCVVSVKPNKQSSGVGCFVGSFQL